METPLYLTRTFLTAFFLIAILGMSWGLRAFDPRMTSGEAIAVVLAGLVAHLAARQVMGEKE